MRSILSALEIVWRSGRIASGILVAATVVAASVPVIAAWLTKAVVDRLAADGPMAMVLPLAAALAVAGLMTAVSQEVKTYATAELGRRVGLLAQARLYRAVNRLPGLARFENPDFLDRLRLAAQSGGKTPAQLTTAMLELGAGVITIGGFLGSLLVISPVMAAAVLAGALPALAAEIALSRRRAAMLWRLGPVERRELVYSELMSSVQAAKETRLFGLGGFLHDRMMAERRKANAEERRMDRRVLATQSVLGVLAALISGAGLVWAVAQARAGALTIGDISMFIAAVAGVQSTLTALVNQVALAHHELLLFAHYRHVTTTRPDLTVRNGHFSASGDIEFSDVWFRYGPDHPWILQGVNLTIPYGKSVGLVGKNGAGKTTLVKLLCRFYDPTLGHIRWNGTDLRDIDPVDLRQRIATVFQDYMSYDMTAAENIGVGDLSRLSNRSEIVAAAERAGAHDAIAKLPRGYDSLVTRIFFEDDERGAEGVFLSGGQGQRVAIARAMLRGDRDLLILDEPSSGLDAEAEYEIHTRLKEYRRGKTSFLISHRLGVLSDADLLLVLDSGKITEQGTHKQLMALGGTYARLFSMQAAGYQMEGVR